MTMILDAPAMRARLTELRPTPPAPKITTVYLFNWLAQAQPFHPGKNLLREIWQFVQWVVKADRQTIETRRPNPIEFSHNLVRRAEDRIARAISQYGALLFVLSELADLLG
jgi:hypothetical protein